MSKENDKYNKNIIELIDIGINKIKKEINFHKSGIKCIELKRDHKWEYECIDFKFKRDFQYRAYCLFCTKETNYLTAIEALEFSIIVLNHIKDNCK